MKDESVVSTWFTLIGAIVSVMSLGQPLFAGEDAGSIDVSCISKLDGEQLERLFLAGAVNGTPNGDFHGRPLLMFDGRNPRMRAAINGIVWKGKRFRDDGTMINKWVGFRAIAATVEVASSTLDGEPCVRLDYPPNAPIFGNAFDELREIAPCVYLGRVYERCPTPRLKGYFLLTPRRSTR